MDKQNKSNAASVSSGDTISILYTAPDGETMKRTATVKKAHAGRLSIQVHDDAKNMTPLPGSKLHLFDRKVLYEVVRSDRYPTIELERVSRREHVRVEDMLCVKYANVSDKYTGGAAVDKQSILENVFGKDYKVPGIQNVTPQILYELLYMANQKLDDLLERMQIQTLPPDGPIDISSYGNVNISASGVRFQSRDRFTVDEIFAIRISLPLANRTHLRVMGKVVSVNDTDIPGTYSVAFQFIDPSEGDRELLTKYVFQRQRELLRE